MIRNGLLSLLSGVFAATAMLRATTAVASADPIGLWKAGDGAHVSISRCGGALCGVLVSVPSATDPETGRPWKDKNNINPNLRNRPLRGVQVMIAMRPSGAGKWSGRLYNTDDGKTYSGSITEVDARTIRVEGCAGALCGGETMTRIK
jgi:uncharacterized protein (DUF2147 family)